MKNTLKLINYNNKVYIYYSNKSKVLRVPTGISVDEKEKNMDFINKMFFNLDKIRADFASIHFENPPVSYMKEKISSVKITKNTNDINYIFNEFIKEKDGYSKNSIKIYDKNFRRILMDFLKTTGYSFPPPLSFEDIDEKFILMFINYMKKSKNKRGELYLDNYIIFQLSLLKDFLNTCADLKLIKRHTITETSWRKLKKKNLKKHKREQISLTLEELNFLMKKRESEKYIYYKRVIDMLLFQCFTSLRFSDLIRVNKSCVVENKSGTFLNMTTQKTNTEINFPLSPFTIKLLKENDYNFNRMKTYNYNLLLEKALKSYSDECASFKNEVYCREYRSGVNENIVNKKRFEMVKSHTGRRTFVTINKNSGSGDKDIMAHTGHSGEDMMNNYFTNKYDISNLSLKMEKAVKKINKKSKEELLKEYIEKSHL
ncbi:MAG: tyrosine-type recombinase/integrase [Bacilli bacterium]|nr:tyrosine-type recombinase/integrase [Bacilli bacterium]